MNSTIPHVMWYLLIIISSLILISALDEAFFSLAYFFQLVYRKWKYRHNHYEPLTYEKLSAVPEKKIAIMVACWQEDLVIGNMLKHNIPAIDYKEYDIFIAVYPNDGPTLEAVTLASKHFNNAHCVINRQKGPTTKANNLNEIYEYIKVYEKENEIEYAIFLFHDSEDIIHPLSLKMYNYLIPRKDMVQIPIFPLEINYDFFTYWTYADEFAENHTHTMIVREFIHGLVPSAGVGTAFSRYAIQLLAAENKGLPFDTCTFTEDYSVSLRIHVLGLKSIFLTQTVDRVETKKQFIWFGKLVPKIIKELVATRALFPTTYMNAVRQRSRWIMGIAFQEWRNTGWTGNFATRYTLFHDRKSLITHLINFLGYIVFGYWIIYAMLDQKPSLSSLLALHPVVWYLILGCTAFMLLRFIQRAFSTYKIYGLIPALLSIPRIFYSNVINFHAILRAYWGFFITPKHKSRWDKTKNTFPTSQQLKTYKQKLGEMLIENRLITPEQLNIALAEQVKSGKKLGDFLVQKNIISPEKILNTLSKQFGMDLIDIKSFRILAKHELGLVTEENYHWLLENNMLPVAFFNDVITLAIVNPDNEKQKAEAVSRLRPYEVKFGLSFDAV
jgi:bacteriophage N4 adsorption protein B